MFVYIASVSDLDDDHDEHFIANLINNSIVTQANTKKWVCPFEPFNVEKL